MITDEKPEVTKVTVKGKGKATSFYIVGAVDVEAIKAKFGGEEAAPKATRKIRQSRTPGELAATAAQE